MSNSRPYIIINGEDSRDITGLLISELPPISKPQMRTQKEEIDGRDGDLVTRLGFEAYDKRIKIALTYDYDIDDIIAFFNSEGTITFSNEPDKYYNFSIYDQIDFERLIKFKTASVDLHVQPFKFSTTEEALTFDIANGMEVYINSNGNADARPNLIFTGTGETTLSIDYSQVLMVDFGEDEQSIYISAEDMNAYYITSPIQEVKADFEPVLDTNGYGSVWIGGAGKNLLNYDVWKTSSFVNGEGVFENNGVTLTATATDCYTGAPNGYPSGAIIPIAEGETITISWQETSNANGSIYIFPNNSTTGMVRTNNQQSKSLSYTATSGVTYVTFRFGVLNSGVTIAYKNIQIEKGSTATAFAPYENIGEISGFTEGSITRTGVNLFDKSTATTGKYYNAQGQEIVNANKAHSALLKIKPSTTYYMSGYGGASFYAILAYDENLQPLNTWYGGASKDAPFTATTPANARYCYLNFNVEQLDSVMFCEAATAQPYKAYQGFTKTLDFGGTYYGGNLNFTSGVLTITHGKYTFDGSEAWGIVGSPSHIDPPFNYFRWYSTAFTDKISNFNTSNQSTLLTCYPTTDNLNYWYQGGLNGDCNAWTIKAYPGLCIRNDNFNDASSFANSLIGQSFVYKLAQPITIQLEPTQINALIGRNNFYSDLNGYLYVTDVHAPYFIPSQTWGYGIISKTFAVADLRQGALANRLVSGDYAKIILAKNDEDVLSFTGEVSQIIVDKYSRWI